MKKYKEVESHVLKNGRVKRPAVDSDAAFVFLAFATAILPAMWIVKAFANLTHVEVSLHTDTLSTSASQNNTCLYIYLSRPVALCKSFTILLTFL